MYDNNFPGNKRIMLIWAELNMSIDTSEVDIYPGNNVVSQSSNRVNTQATNTLDADENAGRPDEDAEEDADKDSGHVFNNLDTRILEGHDWINNYQ